MFWVTAVRRIRNESLRARPSSGVLNTSWISPPFMRSITLGGSSSPTLCVISTDMPCRSSTLGGAGGGHQREAELDQPAGQRRRAPACRRS